LPKGMDQAGFAFTHEASSIKKQQFAQYMKINSQIKIKYRLGVFLSPGRPVRAGEDQAGQGVAPGAAPRLIRANNLISSVFLFVSRIARGFIQGQGIWSRLFHRQRRCRDGGKRWRLARCTQ
jgi:hypothetical protein